MGALSGSSIPAHQNGVSKAGPSAVSSSRANSAQMPSQETRTAPSTASTTAAIFSRGQSKQDTYEPGRSTSAHQTSSHMAPPSGSSLSRTSAPQPAEQRPISELHEDLLQVADEDDDWLADLDDSALAPASANAIAVALPIPVPPPVMKTTWPAADNSGR